MRPRIDGEVVSRAASGTCASPTWFCGGCTRASTRVALGLRLNDAVAAVVKGCREVR